MKHPTSYYLGSRAGDLSFQRRGSRFSEFCFSGLTYACTWELPKIRGTLFWGPHNKDPTI